MRTADRPYLQRGSEKHRCNYDNAQKAGYAAGGTLETAMDAAESHRRDGFVACAAAGGKADGVARMKTITLDDEYSYTLHQSGSISTLPIEPENEAVQRLHEIIKEVTGRDVEAPIKPRMGFLP